MGRLLVVFLSFTFVGVLLVLTVIVALESGLTLPVGIAAVILAMLIFGVLGALTERRR